MIALQNGTYLKCPFGYIRLAINERTENAISSKLQCIQIVGKKNREVAITANAGFCVSRANLQ